MVTIINLEQGMPTVEVAISKLMQSIRTIKASTKVGQTNAIKFIHGYGSSGKGGKIRTSVHKKLLSMKLDKTIREFVPGEAFSPFEQSARNAINLCPELRSDRDFSQCNHGITIVIL